MESLLARRGYLSSRELKAQLESVILENAATSAARCAALCEAQVEAARREERRRALGGEALEQLEASSCGAWTRGFFDAKVENSSSSRPEDAESSKGASAKHQFHITCQTQFGEMDCQRILTDAFSIRGRLSSILAESAKQEAQQPKVHRDMECDPDCIVKTTCKMLEKLRTADQGQPPGAQEPAPSGSHRPSVAPPPGHTRKAAHGGAAEPAAGSAGRRATDQPCSALEEGPAAASASQGLASASQGLYRRTTYQQPESTSSRIGMIRQKTAQTLELGRMLEELTADLQTAHIISPSADRTAALLKSPRATSAPGLQ